MGELPSRTGGDGSNQPRVFLLGRFEVRAGDRLVIDRAWSRRKARMLTELLAIQPTRGLHREQVQDTLWPEMDGDAAANNLHKTLHHLRAALSVHGVGPGAVTLASDVVSLSRDVWIDVEAFRALARQARASGDNLELYEQALGVYAGDLLPEEVYEDWAAAPRDELRALRHQLLLEQARLLEARGAADRAVDSLQALVASDPLHEEGHRALMRLYARLGRRHQALRQYQICREALDRELGVEPSEETEALQRRILGGDDTLAAEPDRSQALVPITTAGQHRRRGLATLYGRELELEMVETLLEAAAAGDAQALFIHGEAGIGKSCLAERALQMVEAEYGALALVGRSYELDQPISYGPVREMLKQVVTVAADHPRAGVLLRDSLYLRRLLGREGEAATPASTDPTQLQIELFDEVIRLFEALALPDRPVALLFDDLHAADDATMRVVHHLCRALPGKQTSVVLLATYRPEEAVAGKRLARLLGGLRRDRLIQEMALEPLSEPAMRLVVERHFGGEPVDRGLVEAVIEQAEGNPFFAGELVRTLVAEGRARLSDGRWRRGDWGESSPPVPLAIHDLLDRRLERLGSAARHVLQAAAIVGHEVEYGLLRHVVGLPEREILDGLDECLQAGVLEETPTGYQYSHGLLREAAYGRMARARRQQMHRAVGLALAEREGIEHDVVGHHFAASDEPWRAVSHLHAAARSAASVFDNRRAMDLYEQAIAIARHEPARAGDALAGLLEQMGDLVRRTGDAGRSATLFEEALRHLSAGGDAAGVFRVRGKAALVRMVGGDVDTAAALLADTLDAMAQAHPGSVPVGRTYYLLAQLRWHSGQYRAALEAAELAFKAARTSGDVGERARAYEALALACHSLGDWQKGVEYELSREALGVPGFDVDEALDVHL